jgi:hypothetical protein
MRRYRICFFRFRVTHVDIALLVVATAVVHSRINAARSVHVGYMAVIQRSRDKGARISIEHGFDFPLSSDCSNRGIRNAMAYETSGDMDEQ